MQTQTVKLCPDSAWTAPTPDPDPLQPGTRGALAIVDHRDAYAAKLQKANEDKRSIRQWCEGATTHE